MNKTQMILSLAREGKGVYKIAKEIYGDTSRRSLNRVWVILNRLVKRGVLSKNQSKEQLLNSRLDTLRRRVKTLLISDKLPLKGDKDRFTGVPTRSEMVIEVREIASEAYALAQEVIRQGNLKLARQYLELVLKCMSEIRHERRELDLETLSRIVEGVKSELSDGQKYRYKLAKALWMGRKTIVMDEFCSTLDREAARIVAYLFQKNARRNGMTLIVATTHRDLLEDLKPTLLVPA